jgi:predicted signal transduction protein with EAL and GGDEF domain
VRPGDTLCRYAGDEFVFLCEDLTSEADAELLASRVDAAFGDPFLVDALEITVSASVGMAFAGPGEDVTDELVAQADTAMYQAKRKGGAAHQVFDLRETTAAAERHRLESDLRLAFSQDQLQVVYQPIVRSADGLTTGAEALLRWHHPSRGQVDPALIIAIAEQSDLITDLGAWILDQACRDHASWPRNAEDRRLDLAVNVSARQLMVPNFFSVVASVLGRTGMDPASLVLEMTEYILIGDLDRAMTVLDDVKTLGVRIALDDFGTGYSSLSYLRQLPIDIVKIDGCFIADIGRASMGEAMVSAVTNLAHVVGLTVIAEGVETLEQSEAVRSIGCELSQGYFFARPMASPDLVDMLGGA